MFCCQSGYTLVRKDSEEEMALLGSHEVNEGRVQVEEAPEEVSLPLSMAASRVQKQEDVLCQRLEGACTRIRWCLVSNQG